MNEQSIDDFDDDLTIGAAPSPAHPVDDFDDDLTIGAAPSPAPPTDDFDDDLTIGAAPTTQPVTETPATPQVAEPVVSKRPPSSTRDLRSSAPASQTDWRPPTRVAGERVLNDVPNRSRKLILMALVVALLLALGVFGFVALNGDDPEQQESEEAGEHVEAQR